jgi:rhodanese-related sulfurtransferase
MNIFICPALRAFTMWLLTLGSCCIADAQTTNAPANPAIKANAPKLVEVAEAEKLIADKKVVVLDVRTAAEFAAGHLKGATNLDFYDKDFEAKLAKLDKTQPYLVNCAVGGRSARACNAMSKLDFKSVFDLKGGIAAWEKAGKPVEK